MNIDSKNSEVKMNFTLPYGKRIVFFLCVTVVCFLIANLLIGVLIHIKGQTESIIRISAVLQDVLVFIAPALITAMLITRLPARFLAIDKVPNRKMLILSVLTLLVSIPAMNGLILWNESISMPDSLKGVEEWMRDSEHNAAKTINVLLGGGTTMSLILSVLIVGIFAGFSEELFFRGAFQRLLSLGNMNCHAAIWLTAFVFSATHLQFYGFFPRMFLGAYFGYLLYWSRCLWVPVIVHITNNVLYIVGYRLTSGVNRDLNINNVGANNIALILVSLVFTSLCIYCLYRMSLKKQ